MCGIAGNNFSDSRLASRMLENLKHRGPDGQGMASDGDVVHGHTRLALVDLSSASSQPFKSKDSMLTFNGEVWNYRELRESLGGQWRTSGDTEVLLRVLDLYGLDGLSKVDGMFAFCWTKGTEAWLVRDRYGKIPLYVAKSRKGFIWSSERKAFDRGVTPIAVPPGFALNLNTGKWIKWYSLPSYANAKLSPEEILEYLTKGVTKRIDADAPVCCLISGGLDSSIILGLAKSIHPDVQAYVAYQDDKSPDLAAARKLCRQWEVNLTEVKVSLSKKDFTHAAECIEIPSKAQVEIAAMCIPLARRISSDGFKACLSGEAADELFGGYGNFCIQASKETEEGVVILRKALLTKMSRGNFIRCNKAFMAHGVECRLPFMERFLVEGAINMGKTASPVGKKLLKRAVEGIVPSFIISRQKETFQGAAGSSREAASIFTNPIKSYNNTIREFFGYLTKD